MRVCDLAQYGEDYTRPVRMLYERSGNCVMNGYLGEDIKDVSIDDDGRFLFSISCVKDDSTIDTQGAVLPSGILLNQTIKSEESVSYRIYSWDEEFRRYTALTFDSCDAMKHAFDAIKHSGDNLCKKDITVLFQEMGLTLDPVTQVLLNQERFSSNCLTVSSESQNSDSSGSRML